VPFNSLRYNPLFPKKLLHFSLLEKWGAKIVAIFESYLEIRSALPVGKDD